MDVIQRFFSHFVEAFENGYKRYHLFSPEDRLAFCKSTKASCVNDFVFDELRNILSNEYGFNFKRKGIQKFMIFDHFLIRIKKLTPNLVPAYNSTESSDKFENQEDLGFGYRHLDNWYLGYVEAKDESEIERIVFLKRNKNQNKIVIDLINDNQKAIQFIQNENSTAEKQKKRRKRFREKQASDGNENEG